MRKHVDSHNNTYPGTVFKYNSNVIEKHSKNFFNITQINVFTKRKKKKKKINNKEVKKLKNKNTKEELGFQNQL